MSLIDAFTPKLPQSQPFVRTRRVPSQPGKVPGKIYLGSDIGFVDFQGPQPRAGDLVHVTGSPGRYVATTGQTALPMTQPTFSPGGCVCKCPASTTGGLIFYLTAMHRTTNLLVIHGGTGEIVYRSALPEVLNGEGVAVDPVEPHNLYILDNRSTYTNMITDAAPEPLLANKNWFTLITYALSGNSYAFQSANVLPGGTDGSTPATAEPVVDLGPNMSVINGVVWIALAGFPARFMQWDGATFSTLTLTDSGGGLDREMRQAPVRIPDKPAKRDAYFTITSDEIVQFTAEGTVTNFFEIEEALDLHSIVSVCNRLIAIEGTETGRKEDEASDTGGGGGEEN